MCKLKEMHLTFRNHDATQPGENTIEKQNTTARKEAVIIHFFFKTIKRVLCIHGQMNSDSLRGNL